MLNNFLESVKAISEKFGISVEEITKMYLHEIQNLPNLTNVDVRDFDETFNYLIFRIIETELSGRTDDLTGIGNRRAFKEILEKHIQIYTRKEFDKQEYDFCLIFFDIDDFKNVNDNLGHDKGDIVLQALAQNVRAELRPTESFFRYGGEEFVLIVEDKLKPSIDLANRIKDIVETMRLEALQIDTSILPKVTISIGVCHYSKSQDIDEFIKSTNQKMYLAKKSGKNKVCV